MGIVSSGNIFSGLLPSEEIEGNGDGAFSPLEIDLKKVNQDIEDVNKKIEEVELELKDAMSRGEKDDVKYLREEKKQLREKEKQLREKELKLLDLRSKGISREEASGSVTERAFTGKERIAAGITEQDLFQWLTVGDMREPPSLVSGLGKDFPFQGRKTVLDQLWHYHQGRFASRTLQDRRQHPIPTFMGQSGIGKSRFLEEHFHALATRAARLEGKPRDTDFAKAVRKACVEVRVTFGNGSGWQKGEEPKAAIAVRMLHSYFAGRLTFTRLLRQLKGFLGTAAVESLTISQACDLIRTDVLAKGSMEPEDNLVIVLGVDEVDKVLVMDATDVEGRRANLTPLIRSLGEALCGAPADATSSIFICPLIAGVVVGDVKEVISDSSHPIEELHPTPLDESDVIRILRSRRWASQILGSLELKRCLADFGGVPLILEAFVKEVEKEHPDIQRQASDLPYSDLRRRTVDFMLEKIHPTFVRRAFNLKDLLFQVLWNREVFTLQSSFGGVTVDDLQRSGMLSLGKDHLIRIPIVYLEMIARLTSPSTSALDRYLSGLALRVLDYEKRLGAEMFECFNQDFIALRLALERHLGGNVTNLSDLYKGAWVGDGIGSIAVSIGDCAVGTTSTFVDRFPSSRQDLEVGKVYRNAAGAPYDLVCLLPQVEGGRLLLAYECKHTRRLPSSKGVKVSLSDVNVAMAKVREAGGGDMPPAVLIFISNRLLIDKVKRSDTNGMPAALEVGGSLSDAVVVVRQNCVEYFGPSLARRFMGYVDNCQQMGEG